MTFGEWIKQPFIWMSQAGPACKGGTKSVASSLFAFLERPFVLAIFIAIVAGFVGGRANNITLPDWRWPWIWPIPNPFTPAPINAKGLHVLMVVDTTDLSKLPKDQHTALTADAVRQYLNATCPAGADGRTKEWRILDKTSSMSNETSLWQAAMQRAQGKQTPWIIVSNPDHGGGYEGPMPKDTDALLALLKHYGG